MIFHLINLLIFLQINMNTMESSKHWLPIGSNLTVKSEMPQCLAEQYPNQHAVKKVEKLKAAKFQMKMLRIGLFKVYVKPNIEYS